MGKTDIKKGDLVTYNSPCKEGKKQEMEAAEDYFSGEFILIKPKGSESDGTLVRIDYIEKPFSKI